MVRGCRRQITISSNSFNEQRANALFTSCESQEVESENLGGRRRILIVDDHAVVRRGLRALLDTEEDMEVSGEAANGREAVAEAQNLDPDVILIDGGLGQLHAALEAFEQLQVRPPMVISLAKKEELIYIQQRHAPVRLERENPGEIGRAVCRERVSVAV